MRLFILVGLLFVGHALAQTPASPTPATPSTERLAKEDPEIKSFVDAAEKAGLGELFTGTGPFTLFAPSNAAIEKFGRSKWQALNLPEKHDDLVNLLIYHVVPGKYMSNTLKTMDVKTIQGKDLHITVDNGEIHVNKAKIVRADMVGPNGVFYIIDTVLEP